MIARKFEQLGQGGKGRFVVPKRVESCRANLVALQVEVVPEHQLAVQRPLHVRLDSVEVR